MEKYFNLESVAVGVIGGLIAKMLGGWDGLLQTIIALVVLDYLTGVIKAIYLKMLSSEIGFKGILKKIVIFIVIATAQILQRLIGKAIPLREIVIMFFIANEGLSLLENAAILVPIPEKLKETLIQIRKKGEGDGK